MSKAPATRDARRASQSSSSSLQSTPGADASASAKRSSAAAKRKLITFSTLGVIALITAIACIQSSKPQRAGDTLSRVFSSGAPCASATIQIKPPSGSNPNDVAKTLFDALASAPGMNTATYNVRTSVLDAGYCESSGSEAAVREALAPTGLAAAQPSADTTSGGS
jgi:hypothetical protein